MPARAQAICKYPGCGSLIPGASQYCASHEHARARGPWSAHSAKRTILGPALQEARRQLFRRNPLCVECEKAGRVRLAVIRDHIIPLSQGGPDIESNTQGLCKECHDLKSETEKAFGKAAARQDYEDRVQGIERHRVEEECGLA